MTHDELVDVVDEDGTILETVSKHQAHEQGLAHRVVLAALFNSRGEWILVRQAGHKQDAGQFVSAIGGHVSSGESEIDALRREVLEEVGIRNFSYRLIARLPFDREILGRKEVHRFAVFEVYSDDPIVLNDESVEYRVFTEADLRHALQHEPTMFGITFHISVDSYYPHLRTSPARTTVKRVE